MAISRSELENFYESSETSLYNFVLRWIWNPRLAEDLVQEAFLRLWRRRDEIDPATLRGLGFKTIQNLALNEIRKNKIRDVIPLLGWLRGDEGTDLESDDRTVSWE